MTAGMKKREVATRLMYSFHCQAAPKSIQHWSPNSGAFSGTARWYMKMIGTEKAILRTQAEATSHLARLPDRWKVRASPVLLSGGNEGG